LRRTGAKARAALQPWIWAILVSINGIYAFKAAVDKKIPAVAFPEAPPGPDSAICVAGATCSCGIGVACVGGGVGTSGSFGETIEIVGVLSGTDEENVVPDENWIPP
jgi:hypothetical protein